jgi:hypothetical protein
LFVGGICWLLIGVTLNFPPKSPLQKLDQAHSLWQAKGSPNYQMDISFGSFSFIGWYRIVVHNNQPVDIMWLPFSSTDINPPHSNLVDEKLNNPKTNPNLFADAMSPNLRDYTIDGLFDIVAKKLQYAPIPAVVVWCGQTGFSPQVTFNNQLGYIESYELSSCSSGEIGGGMLCPVLGDCYTGMRVRNLTLLPPS